jgi:hypothetical protein
MAPINVTPIVLGDRVRMRKSHPCGGFEWAIVRLGADIGLKCSTCGRRVLLPRREFEKRLDHVLPGETGVHAAENENSGP